MTLQTLFAGIKQYLTERADLAFWRETNARYKDCELISPEDNARMDNIWAKYGTKVRAA